MKITMVHCNVELYRQYNLDVLSSSRLSMNDCCYRFAWLKLIKTVSCSHHSTLP